MSENNKPTGNNYEEIHAAFEHIKEKHRRDLGDTDVHYIKKIRRFSRLFEIIGRGLIWILPGPFALLGVPFLFLHRNLESIEIGHNVLHGQYDSFDEIPQFHSRKFRWKAPVDEAAWRQEHNGIHHVHTNVHEKDPDLNHGFLRTNAQIPHNVWHYFQVPIYLFFVYPAMLYNFNSQNLGKNDKFREQRFPLGNQGYATFENSEALTDDEIKKRHRRSIWRVWVKEYGVFPLLALFTGSGFFKVFLANLLADALNNYWIALTIQATHLTEPLQPEDAIKHQGKWYVSQLDSSVNFKGSRLQSILWGHLNYQVEHHLYPDIPSHRYPDIALEVQAVCKKYNLPYKTNESWWQAIRNYIGLLWQYSFDKKDQQVAPSFLEKETSNVG
ncbi:fatty acid desaturase family protein [Litoribacillus peritrichatus]|uniref:Acyl-CoA desaturase n=1 Tax=Litoribacillus peritrichatus TaxID=718191 RepID=A0ABP7N0V2_9GAMM